MQHFVFLNRQGMTEMLKSAQVRAAITELATQIETTASQDEPIVRHQAEVKAEDYTTDRAASAVLIKHPIGYGIQAKYGTLTRAAQAAGLQVKARRK